MVLGVGLLVGVLVRVGVSVGVLVDVLVRVGVTVGVLVGVLVRVGVGVTVGVLVAQALVPFALNVWSGMKGEGEPTPAMPPVLQISPPARPVE